MTLLQIKKYAESQEFNSLLATSQKDVARVYEIARPIIEFLSGFFIVPKKVRAILKNLLHVLDMVHSLDFSQYRNN